MNSRTNKNRALAFLALSLSLFSLTAVANTELARVNGKVITLEEFNRKYPLLSRLYTEKVPTKTAVLEDLIKREIGVQEAKRLKLENDPDVQEEMNTVLYQAYLRKQLSDDFEKIVITDTDAKAWYARNPELRTSHIFVAVAPEASKEEEQKALQRIQEIQNKELRGNRSFTEVAQKFSEGAAAAMGGDIGYKAKGELDPAYYAAAVALRTVGKTSGIVRTQYGYHIIKLTAIRSWNEADRVAVKNAYAAEKRQEIFAKHMNDLRSRAKVSVKSNLLN